MKRIFIILTLIMAVFIEPNYSFAQTSKKSQSGKTAVTKSGKGSAGKQTKSQATQKSTQSAQRKNTSTRYSRGNRQKAKGASTKKNNGNAKKKTTYETTDEIRGLQDERKKIQKEISTKEKELKLKETDVRKRLDNLVQINTEIAQREKTIDTIQSNINVLNGNIELLKSQLSSLESQLGERREKFIESMRYMSRHRSIQDKLMFIFSAKSLSLMYRRLRFVREYAAYQRAQGQFLMEKQRQVTEKQAQLENVRTTKSTLLYKGRRAHAELQSKQEEQQKVVESLKAEQKTLQSVIAQRRQKQSELDSKIDNLIAVEIRKARERAAAEEKKRAAAIAAEKKRRAEEEAKRKAAAEAAARENARRIAEAKAREEKAKAEARAAAEAAEKARREANAEAAKKKERERAERLAKEAAEKEARAEQAAREAEADRKAAELKAAVDNKRAEHAAAEAKRKAEASGDRLSSEDRMLSGSFANNRGRLPMPMAGRIIGHYGQYNVEGLKDVKLSNNGITIKGAAGSAVHSVYAGEVSAVFGFSGTMVVMVRHGAYISVYCNLKSVSVSRGQKINARQTVGTVGSDGIMQFQLRKETQKLNPETWLK